MATSPTIYQQNDYYSLRAGAPCCLCGRDHPQNVGDIRIGLNRWLRRVPCCEPCLRSHARAKRMVVIVGVFVGLVLGFLFWAFVARNGHDAVFERLRRHPVDAWCLTFWIGALFGIVLALGSFALYLSVARWRVNRWLKVHARYSGSTGRLPL